MNAAKESALQIPHARGTSHGMPPTARPDPQCATPVACSLASASTRASANTRRHANAV